MSAYFLVRFLKWSRPGVVFLSLRSSPARSDMAERLTASRPIGMVEIRLTSTGWSRGVVNGVDSR